MGANVPPPLTGGPAIFYSVVMALVLFMGSGALVSGVRLLFEGAPNMAGSITATLMGAFLTGLALWFFYWSFVAGPIYAARLERVRKLYPGQPWMERPEWASRRLTSSVGTVAVLMWVWVAGFCGGIGLIAYVNRAKLLRDFSESWWNVAVAGCLGLASIAGIALAIAFTRKAWRQGVSELYLETLPAFMGDKLSGMLTARLDPRPRHPMSVELACEDVEWVRTGYGKNRETRLIVRPLGKVRAECDPARFVASRGGLKGRLEIEVPTGLPESSRDVSGNGIKWWVLVATTGDDPSFSCEFEVPVYERRA